MLSGSFFLDVQELCRPQNTFTIPVRWFTSIKDIKDLLKQKFNVPANRLSLYQNLSPKSLSNQVTLSDLGIEQDGHILKVTVNITSNLAFQLLSPKDIDLDIECKAMINSVRQGFERSQVPAKTDMLDCTGGVYFLKAATGEKVAVFKPSDEEQGMPNNPKGHAGNGEVGLRPFFRPGQGYVRETAAYLYDKDNFCRVPPTAIVHCEHPSFHYPASVQNGLKLQMFPKAGSLQRFVKATDTFEDISPSLVGTLELQKIALLDMRLLNGDRNSSNILAIRKSASNMYHHSGTRGRRDSRSSSMGSYSCCEELMTFPRDADEEEDERLLDFGCGERAPGEGADLYELVPIDHGYCIPSRLRIDELDWIWFYCPHVAREVDPEIRRYLASLDEDELVGRLERQLRLPEYSCFLLRVAHRLLVRGVEEGLTLFELAQIMARTEEDRPSPLERIIKAAEDNAHRTIETRSNRLNSRGGGSTSGQSLSSCTSGTFRSPMRPHSVVPASQNSTPKVPSSVSRQRSGDSAHSTASRLSRGVQSAVNLEALGRDDAWTKKGGSPRGLKALRPQAAYLSNENIQRLQNSPMTLHRFPDSPSPPPGDFYLAELSPSASAEQSTASEGVALNLGRSLLYEGAKIRTLQSLDSSIRAHHAQQSQSAFLRRAAAAGDNVSPAQSRSPYLRTGRLEEEETQQQQQSAEGAHRDGEQLKYRRSEPIMVALRDELERDQASQDTTSCEASSRENGSSDGNSFSELFSSSPGLGDCFMSVQPFHRPAPEAAAEQFAGFSPLTVDTSATLASERLTVAAQTAAAAVSSPSTDSEADRSRFHQHVTCATRPMGTTASAPVAATVSSPLSLQKPVPAERPFPPRAAPDQCAASTGAAKYSRTPPSSPEEGAPARDSLSSGHSTNEEEDDDDADSEGEAPGRSSLAATGPGLPRAKSQQLARTVLPWGESASSFSSLRSLGMAPSGLQRVTSFNAFESPAIYGSAAAAERDDSSSARDAEPEARQLYMLHREQRKAAAQTPEFQDLRLRFATEAVLAAIAKEVRRKRGLSVSSCGDAGRRSATM